MSTHRLPTAFRLSDRLLEQLEELRVHMGEGNSTSDAARLAVAVGLQTLKKQRENGTELNPETLTG